MCLNYNINAFIFRKITPSLLLLLIFQNAVSQQTSKRLPIIDVHVHAMKTNPNFSSDMCPWFLSNMPGGDPKHGVPSFTNTDCIAPLKAAENDAEMQAAIVRAAKELNVTMVVSGDADIIHRWHKAVPNHIIPSLGVSNAEQISVEAFKDSLSTGFYKVMGEVAPQYQGMSPSDMSLDAYFRVAEELGIPVGIHMGTGGNGMANITSPKYRASLGQPFLLEDVLARHPNLKIWVMHAGYPMIDQMIALWVQMPMYMSI